MERLWVETLGFQHLWGKFSQPDLIQMSISTSPQTGSGQRLTIDETGEPVILWLS
jgi:hypothetical protein